MKINWDLAGVAAVVAAVAAAGVAVAVGVAAVADQVCFSVKESELVDRSLLQ